MRQNLHGKSDDEIITLLQGYVRSDPPVARESLAQWFSRRLKRAISQRHAARLTALRGLDAAGSKISGSGLSEFKGLARLEVLNLDSAPLAPQSVEALAGLVQLKTLCVRDTPLGKEDVQRLRKTLPRCTIEHSLEKGQTSFQRGRQETRVVCSALLHTPTRAWGKDLSS